MPFCRDSHCLAIFVDLHQRAARLLPASAQINIVPNETIKDSTYLPLTRTLDTAAADCQVEDCTKLQASLCLKAPCCRTSGDRFGRIPWTVRSPSQHRDRGVQCCSYRGRGEAQQNGYIHMEHPTNTNLLPLFSLFLLLFGRQASSHYLVQSSYVATRVQLLCRYSILILISVIIHRGQALGCSSRW